MRRKKEIKNKIVADTMPTNEKDVVGEYLSFLKEEKLREFQLLGDFDEENKYSISKEIKEELILLKKYLDRWEEGSAIAILPTKFKNIILRLSFRDLDTLQMAGDLYLIEDCGQQILTTYIASYIGNKKYEFKQEARKAFNILVEEDVDELQEGFFIDEVLGKRKLENQEGEALSKHMQAIMQNKDRDFIIEMYSEVYVLMMLDALSKGGKLGEKIVKEYNEAVKEKKFAALGTKNLYTKLRKTLDATIEKNGGFKALEENNIKISPAIECFLTPVKEMETLILNTSGIPPIKKEEKKEPAPAKAAAKSSAKSGGKKSTYSPGPLIAAKGGGGKKKEEKKEEKKKPVGNGKKDETPKPVETPKTAPAPEKPVSKEPVAEEQEEVEFVSPEDLRGALNEDIAKNAAATAKEMRESVPNSNENMIDRDINPGITLEIEHIKTTIIMKEIEIIK